MRRRRRWLILRRWLRLRILVGAHFRRAILVWTRVDTRLEIEVPVSWRAGRLPFERVAVPRISPSRRAEKYAVEEIHDEDDLRRDHQDRAHRHELIERQQVFERFIVIRIGQPPRE